jgi:RNA polymerase sigma factor (TIGR02999 family)
MALRPSSGEITLLLRRVSAGDPAAEGLLIEHVYRDLRRLAASHLRREYPGHTLQPTELVGKVFLKLTRTEDLHFQDRTHFFRVAARAMRRILVDHARGKNADKRAGVKIPLEAVVSTDSIQIDLILDVDRALIRLHEFDERLAQIVEMRFFGGLSEEEVATALGITSRTVRREWLTAKAWLRGELAT